MTVPKKYKTNYAKEHKKQPHSTNRYKAFNEQYDYSCNKCIPYSHTNANLMILIKWYCISRRVTLA